MIRRPLIAAALLLLACANPAPAEDLGWRLDLGAGAGAILFDEDLRDYRWEIGPTPAVVVRASALRDRYAIGLTYGTTRTVQATGLPSASTDPRVALHSVEARASARILQWQGVELLGQVQGGRLMMRYEPDYLLLTPPGGGNPIRVEFTPIHEWTGGFGAALRHEFQGVFALTAEAMLTSFALDTSHRRGDEIVEQRERFHNWSLGLSASWLLDL